MHWCNVVVTSRMVSVWFPSSTVWSWLGGVQPPAAPPPPPLGCLMFEIRACDGADTLWLLGVRVGGGRGCSGGGRLHRCVAPHPIFSASDNFKESAKYRLPKKKNPKFPLVLSVRLAACYWSLLKKKNFQKCSSAHTSPQIPSLADSLSLSLFSALIFSSVLPIAPLLLDLHHVSIIHVCALLRGNIHLQDENSKHHN